jgi:hypothetical protein
MCIFLGAQWLKVLSDDVFLGRPNIILIVCIFLGTKWLKALSGGRFSREI